MRIVVASVNRPARQSRFIEQAADLVAFELLAGLAAHRDVQVSYLPVVGKGLAEQDLTDARADLTSAGVEVLDPLTIAPPQFSATPAAKVRRLVAPRIEDIYPIYAARELANRAVAQARADAVLIPWSEVLTVLFSDCPAPIKYAYYGDPDPKVFLAGLELRRRFGLPQRGIPWLTSGLHRLADAMRHKQLERCHLAVLRRYDLVGDVAFNDALYYRDRGINASYVRNLWYDRFGPTVHDAKQAAELAENRVIGNLGRLSATSNTFGLHIIAEEVVPALQRRLGAGAFSVHILGGGPALAPVERALRQHSEIVMRGFVDNIDAELQRAKVFLVANNAGPHKVGHTRYLHAWSLGCCVVAHVDAALSMPEIVHGHNALLGRNPEEMAELVCEALADPGLRERLGRNGYQTFKQFFQAPAVAEGIVRDIRCALADRAVALPPSRRQAG